MKLSTEYALLILTIAFGVVLLAPMSLTDGKIVRVDKPKEQLRVGLAQENSNDLALASFNRLLNIKRDSSQKPKVIMQQRDLINLEEGKIDQEFHRAFNRGL